MAPDAQAFYDAALAELTQETPPPEAEGFGIDLRLATSNDIDDEATELDPLSAEGITQAAFCRLQTPRGLLQDDRDGGLDVMGLLNRGTTTREIATMCAEVTGELRKEATIDDATVTITQPSPRSLRVAIMIDPVDPTLGPLPLVISVSGAGVLREAL